MTAYDPTTGTGVQPDFTIQIPVSDSLGGQHTLQLDLLKSTTPNQWYAEIQAVPASDVVVGLGPGARPDRLRHHRLQSRRQHRHGQHHPVRHAAQPDSSIGASDAAAPGAGQVNWALRLGVAAQQVTVGIGGTTGSGALTQFASPSAVQSITTNGTPFGSLSAVSIDHERHRHRHLQQRHLAQRSPRWPWPPSPTSTA